MEKMMDIQILRLRAADSGYRVKVANKERVELAPTRMSSGLKPKVFEGDHVLSRAIQYADKVYLERKWEEMYE